MTVTAIILHTVVREPGVHCFHSEIFPEVGASPKSAGKTWSSPCRVTQWLVRTLTLAYETVCMVAFHRIRRPKTRIQVDREPAFGSD